MPPPRRFGSLFALAGFGLATAGAGLGLAISPVAATVIDISDAERRGSASALVIILRLIVMKTKIGLAMRALSLNPTACSIMGVNNDVVISFTFGLGSALYKPGDDAAAVSAAARRFAAAWQALA